MVKSRVYSSGELIPGSNPEHYDIILVEDQFIFMEHNLMYISSAVPVIEFLSSKPNQTKQTRAFNVHPALPDKFWSLVCHVPNLDPIGWKHNCFGTQHIIFLHLDPLAQDIFSGWLRDGINKLFFVHLEKSQLLKISIFLLITCYIWTDTWKKNSLWGLPWRSSSTSVFHPWSGY